VILAAIFGALALFWIYKHHGVLTEAAGICLLLVAALLLILREQRRGLGIPWTQMSFLLGSWPKGRTGRRYETAGSAWAKRRQGYEDEELFEHHRQRRRTDESYRRWGGGKLFDL
jgi:hypothetical protein